VSFVGRANGILCLDLVKGGEGKGYEEIQRQGGKGMVRRRGRPFLVERKKREGEGPHDPGREKDPGRVARKIYRWNLPAGKGAPWWRNLAFLADRASVLKRRISALCVPWPAEARCVRKA